MVTKRIPLSWYPILAVGLSMVGFISIKTGRDAVFFNQGGLSQLPLAYMGIALASTLAAGIHLKGIQRWGARRTRIGVFLAAALALLAFTPFVDPQHPQVMLAFFIFVPVIFAAVFAAAWLLAGDLLEGESYTSLAKIYARIGAGSMIGGIVGGLMAKGLSTLLEPRYLVASGAIVLVGVAALAARGHAATSAAANPGPTPSDTDSDPAQAVFRHRMLDLMRDPYILTMAGLSSLAALAALFIDFQFYAFATSSGSSSADFFANFYIILNLVSLLLQVFAAPLLQSRYGIGGALFVLPVALLGVSGLVTFNTTVLGRSALRVTEGGLKASIHRSIWEQVFLPIDRLWRDEAKVMVDGAAARMAEGMGAAVLYFWLSGAPSQGGELGPTFVSWAILFLIVIWIGLTFRLRRQGCCSLEPDTPMVRLPDS